MNRDELDNELLQLASIAQQHLPKTEARKRALTKLINALICSDQLCHPQSGQFPAGIYEDIYNEALQELLLYICKNIHMYNPQRGSVLKWVNFLLAKRFFIEAIPRILNPKRIQQVRVPDPDILISPEEPKKFTQIVRECIESDPEGNFRQKHIKNYPQANFQALMLRRISGKPWKEISAEFGIKEKTICSFYYRCLDEFSSVLKEYWLENSN